MKFNEEKPGRKSFGPSLWEGDALVVGESRGKIWRCPLVKTPAGYIGKPVLLATLDMITTDLAISPKGDIVVCCHSGKPDWGTGPKGNGRIFKISYTDHQAPQPVVAYANSPTEIRVAFDRPVDAAVLTTSKFLATGEFVRAADRLEIMRPPYVAVQEQLRAPTLGVTVTGQKLSDDRRTLILNTNALPWRAWYALAIPGLRTATSGATGQTVDVDF